MKKLALGALFVGLLAACGGGGENNARHHCSTATATARRDGACNPLTQTGCGRPRSAPGSSTQTMPQYVGHIGCVPDGTANIGEACTFGTAGAIGYDDCAKGGVCSQFSTPVQGRLQADLRQRRWRADVRRDRTSA